jgi:hypothetical protein
MTTRRELFRSLDPPPGGLALLRARLSRSRRRRAWWIAVPAAAAACAAQFIALRPRPPEPLVLQLAGDPFAQALGLAPVAAEVAVPPSAAGRSAVHGVATSNPNVLVYWIDGTGSASPE